MDEFIQQQEMMFIATSDKKGICDNSFRAGNSGFVRVLDDKTLAYPEFKGNGVMASIGNIMENPNIGLLFIDFYRHKVGLHVNGKARIIENEALSSLSKVQQSMINDSNTLGSMSPERWVIIDVEEAYIHCSKHIPLLRPQSEEEIESDRVNRLKPGDSFASKNCERSWLKEEVISA